MKIKDRVQTIEAELLEKFGFVTRHYENEGFSKITIIPKAKAKLDWGRLGGTITKEQLLPDVDFLKNTMISVATGGQRIQDINDQYKQTYNSTDRALQKLNMNKCAIIPFILIYSFTYAQLDTDTINFITSKKLVIFQLHINKGKALNFIFDTGAGVTVIDNHTATELNLIALRNATIGTAGQSVDSKVSIAEIGIGKNTMDSVRLFSVDLTTFSKLLKIKVDGLIGYDLLNTFAIEVNHENNSLVFHSTGHVNYGAKGDTVRITKVNKHLVIPVFIKNQQGEKLALQMIVDSGSDEGVSIFNHAIEKYDLLKDRKVKTIRSYGVDGVATKNFSSTLSYVRIGDSEWSTMPARFVVDKRNLSSTAYNVEEDGRIGQAILSDCNITYDYKNSLLYIKKANH